MKLIVAFGLVAALFQTVCESSNAKAPTSALPQPTESASKVKEKEMSETENNGSLQQICQKVLDLPKLQQYFHPESKNRKPLHVILNENVSQELELRKFDEPVKFISSADAKAKEIPAFEFSSIEINGKNAAVKFHYAVEGIKGEVS